MPQYIKKEGEVIYLLEYPTDKPIRKDYNMGKSIHINYYSDLELWHNSAVKTPFHDSQKEIIEKHLFQLKYYFLNYEDLYVRSVFINDLYEGILMPDGLCEKKKYYKECKHCMIDCIQNTRGVPCKAPVFAFIKESKPVEETNEDYLSPDERIIESLSSEAIEFAEWTHINGWKFDNSLKKWINYYGQTMNETTQELYKIFKDSITRK